MSKKSEIYSLISKLDGYEGYIDPDTLQSFSDKLFKILIKTIPDKLYRFRSVNKDNIISFSSDEIYLNFPSNYNDPSDCMLHVDPEKVVEVIFADSSLDENTVSGNEFIPSQDYIKSMKAADYGIDTIQRVREGVKVACFSEDVISPLMWSHYADSHRGFALRYDVKSFNSCNSDDCEYAQYCHSSSIPLFPVYYKNKRPDTTPYACACALGVKNDIIGIDDYYPIPLLPLIQKGKDWAYEKEWRYICRNINNQSIEFKPDAIYFGDQMNPRDKKHLAKIAVSKGIEMYDMYIDYYEQDFEMGFREYLEDIE